MGWARFECTLTIGRDQISRRRIAAVAYKSSRGVVKLFRSATSPKVSYIQREENITLKVRHLLYELPCKFLLLLRAQYLWIESTLNSMFPSTAEIYCRGPLVSNSLYNQGSFLICRNWVWDARYDG